MESIKLTVKLKEIKELVQIRRTTKPDLYKRLLVVETNDGQVLYPEIRNNLLKSLDRENIQEGDIIEIGIVFQGSEKEDKVYNNILIQSLKKI